MDFKNTDLGKKAAIGILVAIGVGALLSLWSSPVPLGELLKQPLRSLWGSHHNLEMGVLEVSENMESVEMVTQRLMKPFGVLRLERLFPAPPPADPSAKKPENQP